MNRIIRGRTSRSDRGHSSLVVASALWLCDALIRRTFDMRTAPRLVNHARRPLTGSAILAALLVAVSTAIAAPAVVVEDWTRDPPGHRGGPTGWTTETFGRRADFDFELQEKAGRRVLHMRSRDEHSTIFKDITGTVRLKETPYLEWTWTVKALPAGGDVRRRETTDIAAQLYVVWPRWPAPIRSRIIGYIWDAAVPPGTIVKSKKAPTVTFVVLRSGATQLGQWLSERRNVVEDYQRIFGELPEEPGAISISIDSNDTHSTAESCIGPITFRGS